MDPIPENLSNFYPQQYHPISQFDALLHTQKYKLDLILKYATSGRLLDIGPSMGGFLHLAKNAGFEVEAIEMDVRCANFLNQTLGIPTTASANITQAIENKNPFNLITLWHVMEHLIDPWLDLKNIVQKLSPKGLLVISTPNPDSLQFKLFKKFWAHLDAPRHLSLIPPSLLIKKACLLELTPLALLKPDPGVIACNQFGWHSSIKNVFENFHIKKGCYSLIKMADFFGSYLEKKSSRASAYTMVFQKEE